MEPMAQWRGVHQAGATSSDKRLEQPAGRIALLVGASGNRALLAKQLRRTWTLVEPHADGLKAGSFDLAIVDIEGLRRWKTRLLEEKQDAAPVFLPVVLLLSNQDLKARKKALWDTVDEFIVIPIQPRELTERIALLLRTRDLALAQQEYLAYMVNHDRGTGLPNKNLFMERLSEAIGSAYALDEQLYVVALRIPLSRVMQSFGQDGLERVASLCSSRLTNFVGGQVYVARLTTEEWALISKPGETLAKVVAMAARVQSLADEPVQISDERIHLQPCIGISVYPEDGRDAARLLDGATAALSSARQGRTVFYAPKVQQIALDFIRIQARLHEALEKRQLELWFQPQISFSTGKLTGVEALVRWRRSDGRLVSPADFIPVAEDTGQIVAIDRWVLDAACAAMHSWQKNGLLIDSISVNITAADIESPEFVEIIKEALEKHQLSPSMLQLELTETALLDTKNDNLKKLDCLRSHGVKVAIDDFGTGYSSLGYLHALPITTLKIDKAFVDNVVTHSTDAAIAETIVWLAEKFGLETVAEGIETKEQAELLRLLKVTTAQGYYYGKPLPEIELWERFGGIR